MSAKTRLDAMCCAKAAIDAALFQPSMKNQLQQHGLLEQFELAQQLISTETHEEIMRLMQIQDVNVLPD